MISHVILREIRENPTIKAHAVNSAKSEGKRRNLEHGNLSPLVDRMVQIPVERKGLRRRGGQSVRRKELAIRHDIACGPDHDTRNVQSLQAVSYTHLRAHETRHDLVCRLLLEKKKNKKNNKS